jgi:ATP-dependent helicase HepA
MLSGGMLVELSERSGIGKLVSHANGVCVVSVFRSINRSERVTVALDQLKRGYLSRQTRVYVRTNESFSLGRVTRYFRRDDGLIDYEVRFPNGGIADLSEIDLHVRPWNAPDDPAEVLAAGGAESQFLHDRRHAAVEVLTDLRGASQGLSALSSASVEFVPHQIAAVRRILTDPIQRYLLADEDLAKIECNRFMTVSARLTNRAYEFGASKQSDLNRTPYLSRR